MKNEKLKKAKHLPGVCRLDKFWESEENLEKKKKKKKKKKNEKWKMKNWKKQSTCQACAGLTNFENLKRILKKKKKKKKKKKWKMKSWKKQSTDQN